MKSLFVVLALVATVGRADTTTAPTTTPSATATPAATSGTTSAAIQAPTESAITGVFEVRPTATFLGADNITTENTVGLGYKFNPNFEVGAVQYFDTNVLAADPARTGVDMIVQDAFVRAKFNNLYKTEGGFNFGYEPRLYLPTAARKRDAGMIATLRNYLKFSQKVSDTVTLTAMELPIFHFYDTAGTGTSANPGFENRIYLIADFNLGAGFMLSVPLYFHQTKFRNYSAAAANNDKWDFVVYTWPELTYAATDTVTLGVAYRTENFVQGDLGGLTLGDGIEQGAFQAIMSVSL